MKFCEKRKREKKSNRVLNLCHTICESRHMIAINFVRFHAFFGIPLFFSTQQQIKMIRWYLRDKWVILNFMTMDRICICMGVLRARMWTTCFSRSPNSWTAESKAKGFSHYVFYRLYWIFVCYVLRRSSRVMRFNSVMNTCKVNYLNIFDCNLDILANSLPFSDFYWHSSTLLPFERTDIAYETLPERDKKKLKRNTYAHKNQEETNIITDTK